MAAGIRTRDSSGRITLEVTDRITRYRGTINTGTSAGGVDIGPLSNNEQGWFFVIQAGQNPIQWPPNVYWTSANRIGWDFSNLNSGIAPMAVQIMYGVF